MKQRTYLAIDLKSFYASVECRERGLDPLNTNLVVADESRTGEDWYPSPVWHRCRPGRQAWRCSPLSPPYSPLRVLQLELSV